MVDAEFAVQYLVLSQSAAHPELVDNVGNIALLQRAEAAGLLPRRRRPGGCQRLPRTAPRATPCAAG
jgi:glutamine synthetase adenylyltransferase